jgi:hypothetical protein
VLQVHAAQVQQVLKVNQAAQVQQEPQVRQDLQVHAVQDPLDLLDQQVRQGNNLDMLSITSDKYLEFMKDRILMQEVLPVQTIVVQDHQVD